MQFPVGLSAKVSLSKGISSRTLKDTRSTPSRGNSSCGVLEASEPTGELMLRDFITGDQKGQSLMGQDGTFCLRVFSGSCVDDRV